MASTSRPVRSRNQPSRNRDNVELNMELIERLEATRTNKNSTLSGNNIAKILSIFVNSVNQQYRSAMVDHQHLRKDNKPSRGPSTEPACHTQWAGDKERKRYTLGQGSSIATRAGSTTKPHQQPKMEKSISKHASTKTAKQSTVVDGMPGNMNKNASKEQRKSGAVGPSPMVEYGGLGNMRKPFRRSSYHIGIAYTIYMAQLRERNPGITDPRDCDPTIFARRLKMQDTHPS